MIRITMPMRTVASAAVLLLSACSDPVEPRPEPQPEPEAEYEVHVKPDTALPGDTIHTRLTIHNPTDEPASFELLTIGLGYGRPGVVVKRVDVPDADIVAAPGSAAGSRWYQLTIPEDALPRQYDVFWSGLTEGVYPSGVVEVSAPG